MSSLVALAVPGLLTAWPVKSRLRRENVVVAGSWTLLEVLYIGIMYGVPI
jgi:hypothetical protein